MLNSALSKYCLQLKEQGLYRKRVLIDEGLINFSCSDYLSLSKNINLQKAYQKGFELFPTGSGGSMVICGYHKSHRDLEQAFAEALEADDAILFSSGYSANLGVIALLSGFNASVFIDKAAHASIYDGLRLNGSRYERYLHNNFDHLRQKLKSSPQNPVIFAESVFSMSGQRTDLDKIAKICKEFAAESVVDEAHAFGVLGPEGLGAVMLHRLNQNAVPLRIIPLGKAFGFQGAMVVGKGEWIESLVQFARSQIYSTAVSPALAYGLRETFYFIREADDRRKHLNYLIEYFQNQKKNSFLNWTDSDMPIQQLKLACPHKALEFANDLRTKGIFCQAMRSPTVTKNETGLRVILNFNHQPENIDELFKQLHQIAEGH